jgi:hypothetical protein
MLMAIWGANGFQMLDLIPSECRFNAQDFVEHVMAPLVQIVFPQGRTRSTPRLNVHLENCRVHFSKVTEQFFIKNLLLHVPHPPDTRDLAPSDFWLFGGIMTGLAGQSFAESLETSLVTAGISSPDLHRQVAIIRETLHSGGKPTTFGMIARVIGMAQATVAELYTHHLAEQRCGLRP